jgi:hypothetical protein
MRRGVKDFIVKNTKYRMVKLDTIEVSEENRTVWERP